ncbi:MAG: protein-export membrane protein SecF [Chloroflexi bacterium RBG_13_53_26]|nr:MAG: protein-export membrane protein SecF [Chloroflexi bacterium RBG_13_53_26]
MFSFAAKRHWFLLAAAIVIIFGIISAVVPGGLKYGIDFKAGISITLGPKEGETLTIGQVRDKLSELGYGQAVIQGLGEGEYFIRVGELSDEEQEQLRGELNNLGTVEEFDSVSAAIATETVRNAAIAMGVAIVAMLLYITWAFRKVPSPFRYGTAAVAALVFNLVVTLGIFSIFGRTLGWEIDPMFVTAILAIIGYSVNDTIVVLDRIRENKARGIGVDYDSTVNFSITETLARSLNTSITTVLAVLAVYLIVGGPIRAFLMAMFVGIVAGTYSSIFVAGTLLLMWEHREWSRIIPRIPLLRRHKA